MIPQPKRSALSMLRSILTQESIWCFSPLAMASPSPAPVSVAKGLLIAMAAETPVRPRRVRHRWPSPHRRALAWLQHPPAARRPAETIRQHSHSRIGGVADLGCPSQAAPGSIACNVIQGLIALVKACFAAQAFHRGEFGLGDGRRALLLAPC